MKVNNKFQERSTQEISPNMQRKDGASIHLEYKQSISKDEDNCQKVSPNNRKMDKTTVLKTSIGFLRQHNEMSIRSQVLSIFHMIMSKFGTFVVI